ncbi:MAG: ParB/RepB/Spo0J family partition protein [Bacteroidales bacterium]|nr:ParB/RepB/Spo0J family partition protein [Bacteroidales bacterium]
MSNKKRALGRGLSAILESPDTDITSKDISGNYVVGAVADISISSIEANPFQPRTEFDEQRLKELSDSIKEQGIIQPLTVRKLGYDQYQLISGERRLRASRLAGLKQVPCYIRVANDQQMLEMALVENIQRENLNAIEVAISYQRLLEECKITQEQVADRVGKGRTTVTNYLRLLKLPADVQIAIRDEEITMGHARALITITEPEKQVQLLKQIIDNDLSVRDTEELSRDAKALPTVKPKKKKAELPEKYQRLKENLTQRLETNIDLKTNNKGAGNIVIKFKSNDELKRILNKLDIKLEE